ncbi:MAG: S8 family serine peptidase [candidate division Zixibacteria bacterium]
MKKQILFVVFIALFSWSYSALAENQVAWPGPHRLVMEKQADVIDGKLKQSISDLPEDSIIPVWVFFTDKGIFTNDIYNERVNLAEALLTVESKSRRAKARGSDNLVDFLDLPVDDSYVDGVIAIGAKIRHINRWFNAVTVDASPARIEAIASLDFVRYVKTVSRSKSNFPVDMAPIPPDLTLVSLDYGASLGQLEQINAVVAHELGFKGQGVIICMMDTGYRQGHDAFQNIISSGRLLAQYDFVNGDDNTDYDPDQDFFNQPDHGTLTWSTLGGEASGHLYGPSYMASFVLSKSENLDGEHHIEEDNWAAGALWADSIGASVISASLGYRYGFDSPDNDYTYENMDGDYTIVAQAADLAAYNGIAVATANGNSGNSPGTLISPADADSVIACGAVDPNGNLASFSSYGPTFDDRIKPEVCAQGVYTVCVDPYDMQGYTTASGTSLSTPIVGGVCGVLLSAHPNWTPMMVREALMMTADRGDDPDNHYGWGILDVGRALIYHPEGDVIIDHVPLINVTPGEDIPVEILVSGGVTITGAFLNYREGNSGDFIEIAMSGSGDLFSADIPDLSGAEFQYYFKTEDSDGINAFHPIGGELHPYTVVPGSNTLEDSFEDGLLYWKTGGTHNMWGPTAKDANTGNVSLSDSPNTYYFDNTDSWLESTFSLDLSGGASSMSFYFMGHLQSDRDYLFVEASIDGGENWIQASDDITGAETNFIQYNVSLDDFAGQPDVRLRFHLTTDGSGRRDGVFLDDIAISWNPTEADERDETLPGLFSLNQNYPNPFNPSTSISFLLAEKGEVHLAVYDLLGREVNTLVSTTLEPGNHQMEWDGSDNKGDDVASGVYLYKLRIGDNQQVKMMTLLR